MRIWNKILLVFTFVAFAVCCSTTKMTREEEQALRMKTAQMVKDSLTNQSFKIDVNYVIPNRMPARHLEYGYYIRVYKDSIDAYIPFFGEAYRVEYGTADEGLKFKGLISGYEVKRIKKDMYQVNALVKKSFDEILYQMDIFENGRATIFVRSLNREGIHFSGDMILNSN